MAAARWRNASDVERRQVERLGSEVEDEAAMGGSRARVRGQLTTSVSEPPVSPPQIEEKTSVVDRLYVWK